MNKQFLKHILEHAESHSFRLLLGALIERTEQYEAIHHSVYTSIKENRARREGITVDQIDRQIQRALAKHGPTPDEIKKYEVAERDALKSAASDEELFRLAWDSEAPQWAAAEKALEDDGPAENKPLLGKLVAFLHENRRLLRQFADTQGWTIPEPPRFETRRPTTSLSPGNVRTIRQSIMKRLLIPAGFIKGQGAAYLRRQGNQIHLIDFQASKHGGKFTVNLGFHYTFLPPVHAMRPIALAAMQLADCVTRARIGALLPAGKDLWFDYGNDPERLTQCLEQVAKDCLSIHDRYASRWQDPMTFAHETARHTTSPWDPVSPLWIATIQLRANENVPAARVTLEKYSNDPIKERKAHAAKVLSHCAMIENVPSGETRPNLKDEDYFHS